jgi:hypothetical protein
MHYNVAWTGLCVRGNESSDDVASHCPFSPSGQKFIWGNMYGRRGQHDKK